MASNAPKMPGSKGPSDINKADIGKAFGKNYGYKNYHKTGDGRKADDIIKGH